MAKTFEKLTEQKIMDTHIELIYNKMHSVLKHTIEERCINHFKASYAVYDKRLRRCKDKTLKLSYIENKHLYIESCYKRGIKCGHSYLLEKIIIDLIDKRDYNAIFYDACNNLSEDSIIRNSMRSNSNYFEYVLGYIKDVYNIPKINGFEMTNAILAYFGLGEDFDNNFDFNILKKNQSNIW